MPAEAYAVEEKVLQPMRVAGIRMRGKYAECGRAFGRICRSFGRLTAGPPMMLHYETHFKAEDADFEACIPVRQPREKEGIAVHDLPGGRCVSLVHQGSYEQLGASYEKVTKYVTEHGYKTAIPSREIYLKGPGMIFRGNPKKYLTEIQMMIEPAS